MKRDKGAWARQNGGVRAGVNGHFFRIKSNKLTALLPFDPEKWTERGGASFCPDSLLHFLIKEKVDIKVHDVRPFWVTFCGRTKSNKSITTNYENLQIYLKPRHTLHLKIQQKATTITTRSVRQRIPLMASCCLREADVRRRIEFTTSDPFWLLFVAGQKVITSNHKPVNSGTTKSRGTMGLINFYVKIKVPLQRWHCAKQLQSDFKVP